MKNIFPFFQHFFKNFGNKIFELPLRMVVKAYQFLKNRSPNVEVSERSIDTESDLYERTNSIQCNLPDVEKSCLELKENQRQPGSFESISQSPARKRSILYADNDETANKIMKIEAVNSSSENEEMEEIPHCM